MKLTFLSRLEIYLADSDSILLTVQIETVNLFMW